jgi:hypothetical protein
VIGGVTYYSAENYFQAQKSVGVSQEEFERTRNSGCGCDVWTAGMSAYSWFIVVFVVNIINISVRGAIETRLGSDKR